jgi:mono/diheme cytochrome c family protein
MKAPPRGKFSVSAVALLLGAAAVAASGCGNMKKQRNARVYDPSSHFKNGASAQLPPAHTVAQGTGGAASRRPAAEIESIAESPLPVNAAFLARGRERFNIYCAVCHGADGYGSGIVVRRGFPAPPNFHDDRLRQAPLGHFFNVMTHGYGVMYSYADRLDENDRWAVAEYIRALQRSQHATLADVPPDQRANLERP